MALIVQAYGATALADVDRLRAIAARIDARAERDRIAVVVAAMGRTSAGLQTLADNVSMPLDRSLARRPPDPRDLDMLLASGELVSAALLTMELKRLGRGARAFTGAQAGVRTDDNYTDARIVRVDEQAVRAVLQAGDVPVIAGAQGVVSQDDFPPGEITTLGRDGADLTAVALCAALGADVCEIYTDVGGVFTADPNVVPDARKLQWVTHEEMLEMASRGASILQSKAVEYAKEKKVVIHVRSSFTDESGTFVTEEEQGVRNVVTGVTSDWQCKVQMRNVPDKPGIAAQVFQAIAEEKIVVDVIVQNISHLALTDISFTVGRADGPRAREALTRVKENIGALEVRLDDRIAKVTIVGTGMRSEWGVAAKMFRVLADHNINIQAISTSEIAISCVIEDKYTELAVRSLAEAFNLSDRGPAPDVSGHDAGTGS